ncbi:hypothetical protein [Kitasatospora sp. SUK 42]|uniref:hypothetical protein n=1 Tax=Kitasatospora sp. SUK 42 TaxID=1588882 RepID=UPI0018C9E8F9|nr:hypothetical protein [Kitasatospora sp. SUK 42]MBV2156516.1 hypothetical protein [Kitasatospora sp. SUK 42]
MARVREPQSAIVNRLLKGEASRDDATAAETNFLLWLRHEWDADGDRALAACAKALDEAGGEAWQALPERDLSAHVWLFSFSCPRRDDLRGEAGRWVAAVQGNGGARAIAQLVRRLRGQPE